MQGNVLVTGAGGSIGSELCRQLVRCGVSRLILLERSESALFDIHSELAGETDCVPELLDITDSQRLSQVLNQYRPPLYFMPQHSNTWDCWNVSP